MHKVFESGDDSIFVDGIVQCREQHDLQSSSIVVAVVVVVVEGVY